jgi:hypothetical protein
VAPFPTLPLAGGDMAWLARSDWMVPLIGQKKCLEMKMIYIPKTPYLGA